MKKYIVIICLMTFFISCNNSRVKELENQIEELENQVSQQETVIKSQAQHIFELESQLSAFVNYYNQQVSTASENEWHRRNAEQHMRSAEFWRQSGNEFFYESEMRNAQSDLNMIH